MLAQIPTDLKKISKECLDKEILRIGMIAELDAVSFYEQLAGMTQSNDLKKLFLEIAREEKTHLGEFQAMLLRQDKQQEKELEAGKKEVEKLI